MALEFGNMKTWTFACFEDPAGIQFLFLCNDTGSYTTFPRNSYYPTTDAETRLEEDLKKDTDLNHLSKDQINVPSRDKRLLKLKEKLFA